MEKKQARLRLRSAPFYDGASGKDIYSFNGALDRLMKVFQKDIGFDAHSRRETQPGR